MSATRVRMSKEERREQILDAATQAFAEHGFAGTTTDQVAQAAGVSQPYVVRIFGSKRCLFRAVFERIGDRIVDAFEAVPAGPDARDRLGDAYVELLADRNLLRVLMHGFVAASDPDLGASARAVLVRAFEIYQERTGEGPEEARSFVATGMLINVLLATEAPEHTDEPGVGALLTCAVGADIAAALVRGAA
ncbi:TetR/AcrR family transcriptional regulator [Luteimicrobium subarcticum]|uniref:TetR family transcriptional regulator n=1 Tax=Luteimicrobium subarcticum TaxID=620910 RepID=A0A2M8WTY0_9MICO|nr:TetR/AcrR family transcriptional regulator [Luteimicrobium subarcticum]PJI94402.1 TetR family transcriptional regulator [Luteimicrobium subarcticum]